MLLVAHFLASLFCGIFTCYPHYEEPFDPLHLARRAGKQYDDPEPNPVVQTKSGAVRGYVTHTILGRPIYTFEGIPYGENTAGHNRFRVQ